MITIRPHQDRGHANYGWLDTNHTFSFANYHDPEHTGFRSLRVINEDRVAPGKGFGTHPHRDMEILTYVINGALEHKDSMGHTSVLSAGEVQRITAGTGITHSEYNASESEPVHFYQIWLFPEVNGLVPGYEQAKIPESISAGSLHLIAKKDGGAGAVMAIHQDVNLYFGRFDAEQSYAFSLGKDRHAWVQVIQGEVKINGLKMGRSDGASVSDENHLSIDALEQTDLLIFDLA